MSSSASVMSSSPTVRIVLQQCLSARLMVKPASGQQDDAEYVQIDRGLIVYVCFLKGAVLAVLDKTVKSVLSTRLSAKESGKLVSILDLPGDVLIVPQATLGGRLKGKMMQYHTNVDKDTGLNLYTQFVSMCEETVKSYDLCKEKGVCVRHGTYGNTQVLSMVTNGPYTHMIEL